MTTPSPETPKIPEGKDQETREVAERVKSALSALRASIKKPNEQKEVLDRDHAAEDLVHALADAGKLEEIANGKAFNDPELMELMKRIEEGNDSLDATTIIEMLKEQKDDRADLEQLADEIAAVDAYLAKPAETAPEKKSFYTQISEKITQFTAEKLPDGAIKEMAAKFKMDMNPEQIANVREFIVNMVRTFIAGMVEKIPGMQDTAGNLRWDTVLSQAKSAKSGLGADQRKQLGNPEQLTKVKSEWVNLYKVWLRRKREAAMTKTPFAEEMPTIASVFAQREYVAKQEAVPTATQKKLFGVEGLEQNKELVIEKETPLVIEGKKVVISREKITVGDKTKTVKGKVEALTLLTPSENPNDLHIKFKVEGQVIDRKLNEDIVKKFESETISLSTDPSLTLEIPTA